MSSDVGINIRAHDRATGVLNHVGKRMGVLNKQGLSMGLAFAAVNIGVAAMQRGFQAMQQWLGDSIKKYREFEKAMSEVETMLSEFNESLLPEMTEQIGVMSIAFGKSAVDLSRGLYQVLSAGIDASESMDVLRDSGKLAVATLTSVETAVGAVTTILNAYGLSGQQAGYVTNLLAKTIQIGVVRMDELATAWGYVASMAASAGVEIEEVSAIVAAFTKQGMSATMGARGLRQLMSGFISPTPEVTEAMGEIGVVFDDLMLEGEGVVGILDRISEATEGDISQVSRLIPNIRALATGLATMGQEGALVTSAVEYMNSEFDALNEMYEDVASSSDFARKQLEMLHDEIDRGVGEALEPAERAWNNFLAAMKLGVTDTKEGNLGEILLKSIMPWVTVVDTVTTGYDKLNGIQEEAEAAKDELLNTEEVDAYAAHFERLNDKILEQSGYLERLADRHELYKSQLVDLKAQRDIVVATESYKEALSYIPLALKDATFTNKIFDVSTRALVDSIRMQREEIEGLDEANRQLSINTRTNSIEAMKIQLSASTHRGRMSRTQKRRLEELSQEDMKSRIATMENQQLIDQIKDDGLTEEEKRLEQVKTYYSEHVKTLTDAYNRELKALDDTINAKKRLISDYYDFIAKEQQKYVDMTIERDRQVAQHSVFVGPMQPAVSIEPRMNELSNSKAVLGDMDYWKGRTYDTGTPWVPRTGPAWLHEGERVVPRSQNVGGGGGNITVRVAPITVNAVLRDEMDISTFGSKIGQAIAAGLVSGIECEYNRG